MAARATGVCGGSRGITDLYQGQDAFMAAIYLTFAGKAEFLGTSFDDYIRERVQAKAREFNSMLNDPSLIEELDADEIERRTQAYLRASKG